MTSLPVPLSPVMRMETSLGATRSTVRTTSCMAGLWKIGRSAAAHGGEGAAQGIALLFLLFVFQRALERDQQGLRVERLVDEMKRAAFGRLHGGFERGFAGEHDDFACPASFF